MIAKSHSGYFLVLLALLVACGTSRNKAQPNNSSKTPNIIFILADDLGYGDVQAYNPEGKISTPYLNRLADEGIRFTNAHSSSAVCTPSRYSILTGRYPWRTHLQHGVLWGYSPPLIDSARLTVAGLLQQHGYYTGVIGKWHLGLNWPLKEGETKAESGWEIDYGQPITGGPLTRGFDYFYGISASLDMPPYVYIENDRTVGTPTVLKRFPREGVAEKDFEAVDVLPVLAHKAKQWLTERSGNQQPFFLYLPLTSPHTPIVPHAAFKGKSGLTEYGDFVMATDWAVGEVMKTLDSLGISDNTMVFFGSDNGFAPYVLNNFNVEALGHFPSADLRGYKADAWEGGHRIPFIVRWPAGIKAGSTYAKPVSMTDFMATCADLLDATLPDNAAVDSYSLLPVLEQPGTKTDRPAVIAASIDGNFTIQEGKWKLILAPGSGGWAAPRNKKAYADKLPLVQLYDMETDVSEKQNLEASHPEIVQRLTQLLEQWVANGRSTPGAPQQNDVEVDIWKKNYIEK